MVFGGNTSCVSIEYQNNILIFDAGTGLRKLGNQLMTRGDLESLLSELDQMPHLASAAAP